MVPFLADLDFSLVDYSFPPLGFVYFCAPHHYAWLNEATEGFL